MLPKLFITDIDGVWTDGGMYYTAEGDRMKKFSVKDGWGVAFLHHFGIPVVIMTGENTQIVAKRAQKLGIEQCYLGVRNKLAFAQSLCKDSGITLDEVAFIGDDINDIALLKAVGFSGCPANSAGYIKSLVNHVGMVHGGYGAFREFVETILEENSLLQEAVAAFTDK